MTHLVDRAGPWPGTQNALGHPTYVALHLQYGFLVPVDEDDLRSSFENRGGVPAARPQGRAAA